MPQLEWMNYHHLLYFWMTAREGSLTAASRVLRLAHPTLSAQIKQLEAALGEKLFERSGRRLELTEVGRVAYRYADEIFGLGQEFLEVLKGRPTGRPVRLRVGITEVLPKLVARELLRPAFSLPERLQVVCEEDRHDRLLAELALHNIDVVLADAPVPAGSQFRAFNHLLGECGVTFFARRELATRYKRRFPAALDGAPFLLPTRDSALRRSLERWMDAHDIRPDIVAEFEDSALLKVFGQDGLGVFCAPSIIEEPVKRQYHVHALGHTNEVVERFYAISMERRIKNPGVSAICTAARTELFS